MHAALQVHVALAVDPVNWQFNSYEVVFGADHTDEIVKLKKRLADGSGWDVSDVTCFRTFIKKSRVVATQWNSIVDALVAGRCGCLFVFVSAPTTRGLARPDEMRSASEVLGQLLRWRPIGGSR